MLRLRELVALPIAGLVLSACATEANRIETTRFHLGQEIARGDVRVLPNDPSLADSLETRQYAEVIGQEFGSAGFRMASATAVDEVVLFSVNRVVRPAGPARAPLTIGIGGGTGGGGFGIGVGTSFPVGKPKARELVSYELHLRLRRERDNAVIWEGRARTEAAMTTAGADPRTAVARMTRALLKDFPGESGKTITVK